MEFLGKRARVEKKHMKKILITGGAGFVGLHLTRHILEKDAECSIVLTDNFQRGRRDKELQEVVDNDRVEMIEFDLTDRDSYKKLGRGYDHIYHLAAVNGTKNFYEIPEEVLRINTLSVAYILEWMKKKNPKGKIMFPSSNEAYASTLETEGENFPIPTPEDVPLSIKDTYNPRWSYAGSKLIGELFFIHYCKAYNLRGVIVRPHNFYGPRAGYEHVIPQFVERVAKKIDPFPIYGTENTRTFCYIEDAVQAMRELMESEKTNATPIETVHIGTEEEITMEELAERVFKISGWRPGVVEKHRAPEGSTKRRKADTTKIKELIHWEPETTLEEGLKKTYDWYVAHPRDKIE